MIGKPQGKGAKGKPIYVRVGRYGPFLEQGRRRASLPEKSPPDELTLDKALEMLDKATQGEEPLGICPDTHKPVFLKTGRFGPYVQRGTPEDGEKPQNASLLKGMTPDQIDLQTALKLLSLPRQLGDHPERGEAVEAYNGRFGPYVKCGDDTRSLPENLSPLDITLPQAVELLAQPKGYRGRSRRKEPIRELNVSPVTGEKVRLMDGRYGPYVTDGTTNASLPRGTTPEEVTFESALELLAARAAKGPPKRPRRKKAAKKATAKKKRTKKTTKKKSAKRGAKKKT